MTTITRPSDHQITKSHDLLGSLRESTRQAHHALDSRLAFAGGQFVRTDYVALLRATLSVMRVVEEPVAQLIAPHYDWTAAITAEGPASRSSRIEHDLQGLAASTDVTPAPDAPPLRSCADAFGAAYVLQGSLLGGAVIARIVHGQPELSPAQTTYLRLYGEQIGPVWREFTGRLNAFGRHASADEWQRATQTAVALFTAFSAALSREGIR